MHKRSNLLIGISLLVVACLAALALPATGRDFIQFWTAGRALSAGISPYDQAFQAATQQANGWDVAREPIPFQPYFYPPWLAVLMWPLSLLPYVTARSIWLVGSLAGLMALSLIAMRINGRPLRPVTVGVALLMSLTYLPALHMLAVGQINVVLVLLLAMTVWASQRHHDRTAGVALGLMSIKPHLSLIIVAGLGLQWLLQRRWTALAWLVGTVGVCVGLAFVVAPNWPMDMLAAPQRYTDLTGWMFPLNGYQDNPTLYAWVQVGIQHNAPWLIGSGLLAGGAVVLALVRRLRSGRDGSIVWLSAVLTVAVFILAPYARAYDLVLLLWPMFYLAFLSKAPGPRWPAAVVVGLVYAWPLILPGLKADGVWNIPAILILAAAVLMTDSPARSAREAG